MVRRKAGKLQNERVLEIELYTTEADPGFAYNQMLQVFSGANADFA